MKILLINLDDAKKRMEHSNLELSNVGLSATRVSAVDGRELPESEIKRVYDEKSNRQHYFSPLHRGEIGCFLSHRSCWQKIVDENLDYALILEDDFEVIADLAGVLAQVEEKDYDFDLLKLDGRNISNCHKVGGFDSKVTFVQPALPPLNFVAYIVSFKGAKKLLTASETFYYPVDVFAQLWWEGNLTVWSTNTPVINQHKEVHGNSTLKARKTHIKWEDKLKREFMRPVFRKRLQKKALSAFSQLQH